LDRIRFGVFDVKENAEAMAPECAFDVLQTQSFKIDEEGDDSFENTQSRFEIVWIFRDDWIGSEGIDFDDVLKKIGLIDQSLEGIEHPKYFFCPQLISRV